MDWMSQIGGLLQQYGGGGASRNAENDFDRVAQHAPTGSLADGLSAAFRSNETPAFGDMVAGMFSNATGAQKASLINILAPIVLSQVMGGRGGSNNPLGALLGASGGPLASLLGGGNSPLGSFIGTGSGLSSIIGALAGGRQVTPEMAERVSPDVVRSMAEQAEKHDPSIIDTLSNFYAEHPTLVKSLGAVALTIAINQIANRRS